MITFIKKLVNLLTHHIGSFGPRNVPKVLRAVEILGIHQARRWGCASLNEFRKFFGLKEYNTFEEINSDPEISSTLRNLYEHPDHVELYPGIVSEESKFPMVPGAGICPTYTISKAILSDAVALVRGDRFYTVCILISVRWLHKAFLFPRSTNKLLSFIDRLPRKEPDKLGVHGGQLRL